MNNLKDIQNSFKYSLQREAETYALRFRNILERDCDFTVDPEPEISYGATGNPGFLNHGALCLSVKFRFVFHTTYQKADEITDWIKNQTGLDAKCLQTYIQPLSNGKHWSMTHTMPVHTGIVG